MQPITIHVKLTFQEYLRLTFILTYRRWTTRFLTALSLLAVYLFLSSWNDSAIDSSTLLYWGLLIGLGLYLPFAVYLRSRKLYRSSQFTVSGNTYTISEDELVYQNRGAHGAVTWELMNRALDVKDWLLVYPSATQMFVFPKSSFSNSSELTQVKDLLKRRGIKTNF